MGAVWIVTNALFPTLDSDLQYATALASYAAIGLFITFFLVFSLYLVNRPKYVNQVIVLGLLLAAASAIPGTISTGVENNSIQTTTFIGVYAIWFVSYSFLAISALLEGRKKVASLRRKRIDFVIIGILISLAGGVFFNLVLPILGEYRFTRLGPVFSLVFISFFAYSVMKHHLFDIRRAIARVMAYTFSVALLGGVLGYGGYLLYEHLGVGLSQPVIFVLIGLAVSFLFPVVKNIFDSLTNKIFLSGTFDIQLAIDQMGSIYASTSSIKTLEKKNNAGLSALIQTNKFEILYEVDRMFATRIANVMRTKTVLRDTIEDEVSYEPVLTFMQEHSIAIIIPLLVNKNIVGYLCGGNKSNGASYSLHDIRFLDTISDELAVALQSAQRYEEIKQLNDDLQIKIDQATAELRKSNKKLLELDETKDEFISMASHQLRTPLTSVKGYISMLLDEDMGALKPTQRKVLEEAYGSSQRMVYLIGDFLNLSRLRTGKFIIERSPVSLSQLIQEEIAQLKAAAELRNVTLRFDAPSEFPMLSIDETKMRQVMMNFIDNAIYYAKPEGGTVNVTLSEHQTHISFKVDDDGIGVPKAERSKLFTKFYRAENAKKARPDGTGVGLFMAKKVVDAHEGTILFDTKENKGSTFGFRLPLIGDNLYEEGNQTTDNK